MNQLLLENAWVDSRWQKDVLLQLDQQGVIRSLESSTRSPETVARIGGFVLPGIPNVHSHAFQRGMVGLTEYQTGENDSFWTWRQLMYQFLESLSPDDVFHIAKQLFREMLAAGYTTVGEFQYIHNRPDGVAYESPATLCHRVIEAAVDVGIGICILPVLYQRGGFDNRPLRDGQGRFQLSDRQFIEVIDEIREHWQDEPLVSFGMALHSLRAIDIERMPSVIEPVTDILGDCPIHIHIAEQTAEVEACNSTHGLRPVEWLFRNCPVDSRWCLIHATHLSEVEIDLICNSQAVVGLCPMTEANLGDGIFPAPEFLSKGGKISIGSDSHISINPFSELRMIEYGQRLTRRARAVLCDESFSTGTFLARQVISAGSQTLSRNLNDDGGIAIGNFADLIVVNERELGLPHGQIDRAWDKLIFFESQPTVEQTWVGGRKVYDAQNRSRWLNPSDAFLRATQISQSGK